MLADERCKISSFDVLHREKVLTVLLADFINRDDVRMAEISGCFGFGAKTLHKLRVCELAVQEHFDRDGAIERNLPRLVNHSHATALYFLNQLVIAENRQGWLGVG